MKTVKITEGFTGYPTEAGGEVLFVVGDTSELSDAYADLILAKGHAVEIDDKTKAKAKTKKDDET